MLARISSMIALLDNLLLESANSPAQWAADLQERMEALLKVTANPDFFVPVDLPASLGEHPRRRAQRAVLRYGQLLECWPDIIERTICLKNKGITVGRCLNETLSLD